VRQFTTILITLAMIVGLSLAAFAGDKDATTEKAPKPEKKAEKVELKAQTVCPVMGGKIDSTQYTDIQGQRVYHCCGMCSAKLKADPDKYFKQAAAEGVLFENIQTTCPVSGKKLESKTEFVDYQGRRIYFCCDQCPPKFMKDPQAYLAKMGPAEDSPALKDAEKGMNHDEMKQDGKGHEGHK